MEAGGWRKCRLRSSFLSPQSSFLIVVTCGPRLWASPAWAMRSRRHTCSTASSWPMIRFFRNEFSSSSRDCITPGRTIQNSECRDQNAELPDSLTSGFWYLTSTLSGFRCRPSPVSRPSCPASCSGRAPVFAPRPCPRGQSPYRATDGLGQSVRKGSLPPQGTDE
jgi:hypothetical protein